MSDEKLRELVVHTRRGPDRPHVIYEMAECHPDFFTKEETWRLVERSAYDQLMKEARRFRELSEIAVRSWGDYNPAPGTNASRVLNLLEKEIDNFDKKYPQLNEKE